MKDLSVKEMAVVLLLVIGITFALVPAFARIGRSPSDARCQSNIYDWSRAIALYAVDNCGTYPTNRTVSSGGVVSATVVNDIPITPSNMPPDSNGNPIKFYYGFNWVEAVEPYLQAAAARSGQDWKSFQKCPNASATCFPASATYTAQVSYAFNYNLVEQQLVVIGHNPQKLMLLREMDRMVQAVLRPTNISIQTIVPAPRSPFLSANDTGDPGGTMAAVNPNLHGNGSYIAFADGHVTYFTSDYFPDTLTAANCYDSTTMQWYNYGPGSGAPANLMESIAISP